jgi:CBS domain-containing protein
MYTLIFYLFIQIDLQTKLIEVLRIFQTRPISALPVVDSEKRLCDVYSKFDIIVKEIFSIF